MFLEKIFLDFRLEGDRSQSLFENSEEAVLRDNVAYTQIFGITPSFHLFEFA